jgi:hypothetical protein
MVLRGIMEARRANGGVIMRSDAELGMNGQRRRVATYMRENEREMLLHAQ